MIRLPSSHAAITAPLVTSSATFPGIPIGVSLLDGRAFHLSPVLAPASVLPATNSLALGGLGSGKSTTAKARARREILDHDHQYVVIDSFGEDSSGEWAPLTRSLGGAVIEAGTFTLNPCSDLLPPEVREQLVRALILAVEPGALTHQATHALQHALTHPKATALGGVVDALVRPEDGRWPADRLTEWGEGAAIALSRYTEGSLRGLFDGEDASLPPHDLPILSFDFSSLDRGSPAIPALMAAVSCWAEHVWLRQSTAPHRHLVLEEAWQILLSPATAELIQRLLKNSRKAGLSLDVVMHTLSDLGEGRAQDLARLCEVAHIGRLGPEEAALVGALLGLPQHIIERIPTLDPGQAVWKVGPNFVDIVQTQLDPEEIALTDTSTRRRAAQHAAASASAEVTALTAWDTRELPNTSDGQDDSLGLVGDLLDEDDDQVPIGEMLDQDVDPAPVGDVLAPDVPHARSETAVPDNWAEPFSVVDIRHHAVLQAAAAGRLSEAADLAALGERDDITMHGIASDQAAAWLVTRAHVADLAGNPTQAAELRATVTRMGKDVDWFNRPNDGTDPEWHRGPQPPPPVIEDNHEAPITAPRRWPYVAAIAALAVAALCVWLSPGPDQQQEREEKAAAYKGRSGAALTIDGVKAEVVAQWNPDRDRVTLELRTYFDRNSRYLRIDVEEETASSVSEDGWYPQSPKISVPVDDPLADVTARIAVGGKGWKGGTRAPSREIRLSPTGIAYGEDGERLPSDI